MRKDTSLPKKKAKQPGFLITEVYRRHISLFIRFNHADFSVMGFFHVGFLLTTAPETCHVWNQCWGDTSGSKVLKLDYTWLQWFQGMAIPSGEAGPGCAGAFADSSAEFI